jgi:CheY-like chemotaxis protein
MSVPASNRTTARQVVLVIEDDASIRSCFVELLDGMGYRVESSRNGWEALARLGEGDVGLIFLDLTMPVVDGYAFLREKEQREASRRWPTPVVVITAQRELRALADHRDVVGVLPKPFGIAECVPHLEQHAACCVRVAQSGPISIAIRTGPRRVGSS